MKPNEKLLEALVAECRWRDKVSELFGPEWDGDGAQLLNYCWELCYQRWGEQGMNFIGDFISYGKISFYSPENVLHELHTSKEVFEALETYFKDGEKENEV